MYNTNALENIADRWPRFIIKKDITATVSSFLNGFNSQRGVSYVYEAFAVNQDDAQIIREFAADNAMKYTEKSTENLNKLGGEHALKDGPAWINAKSPLFLPVITHEVEGLFRGFPLVFCVATYSENEAFEQTGIVRIKLPKIFPQIVLDSNRNDTNHVSSVPASFKSDQMLHLEGNFSNYFDLFAPRGLQSNTLSVLAPNFMQMLINCSSDFDVEFFGDEMILSTKSPLYTPKVINEVAKVLTIQLDYLNRLLSSWNYIPRQQPFDKLERSFIVGNVIKVGSKRVSTGTFILAFFAFWMILFVIIIIFS